MRLGCLLVPQLPLQARLRAEPELLGQPLVLAEGEGPRTTVAGAAAQARAAGVRRGLGLDEARALCPALVLRRRDPALEEAARLAVLDAAGRVSPRVEQAEPGVAWVDAAGLSSVWGDERAVASALVAAAHRVGLFGKAAVAGGKRLARLAAERGEGLAVVPEGQERAWLARLPLAALPAPPELVETLQRWGLRTAGELAALPAEGVGTRLGQAGLRLHRLVTGEDQAPLLPLPEPERYEERIRLDYGAERAEQLLFLLRPLLERLLARLECRGLAAGALALNLELEPHGEHRLPLGVAAPTTSAADLLGLARLAVEAHPPGAPVCGLRAVAEPARARRQQLGLWDLPTAPPARLLGTVAQVAAIVGPAAVGRLRLDDSHLAERRRVQRFEAPPPASRLDAPADPGPAHTGLRRLRPPREAEVQAGPEGPRFVRASGVRGRVVACAGPWRVEVGWHGEPTRRDLYEVELAGGVVYLLERSLDTGAWQVLGWYD